MQGAHVAAAVEPGDGQIDVRMAADVLDEGLDPGAQLLAGSQGRVGTQVVEEFLGGGPQDGVPEPALRAEVVEEQPGGDARLGGHGLDADVVDRPSFQEVAGGGQQLAAAVGGEEPGAAYTGRADHAPILLTETQQNC